MKDRLSGLKLHVMYFDRIAGRLHTRATGPRGAGLVRSSAHVIWSVAESADRVSGGMVQLTLVDGSTIPKSPTCCGLPPALSATFNSAATMPDGEEIGVNVTLIGQLLPAATLAGH